MNSKENERHLCCFRYIRICNENWQRWDTRPSVITLSFLSVHGIRQYLLKVIYIDDTVNLYHLLCMDVLQLITHNDMIKVLILTDLNHTIWIVMLSFRGRNLSPRAGQQFEGLTGPSYKLEDKSYPLPNPKSLRVRQESKWMNK